MMGYQKYGPKPRSHQSIGTPCPACGVAFEAGDYTTLVPLGPGADPEEQARARRGEPYADVSVEVHFACAGGVTP
jgi:hypothetical protein